MEETTFKEQFYHNVYVADMLSLRSCTQFGKDK